MKKEIKTIIWDLGGVLIDWNPRYVYKKLFHSPHAIDYFLDNVCTPEWNEEQDGGRSFDEATNYLVYMFPEYSAEIKSYYGRWEEMLGEQIHDSVAILEGLKNENKFQLLALTNWSAEAFPVAYERFDFLKWFDGILVSGVEKMKKPDPAIYELVLNRFHADRAHSLFIDDNHRNVLAARSLGIDTIHFINAQDCKIEIERRIYS